METKITNLLGYPHFCPPIRLILNSFVELAPELQTNRICNTIFFTTSFRRKGPESVFSRISLPKTSPNGNKYFNTDLLGHPQFCPPSWHWPQNCEPIRQDIHANRICNTTSLRRKGPVSVFSRILRKKLL